MYSHRFIPTPNEALTAIAVAAYLLAVHSDSAPIQPHTTGPGTA